MWLLILEALDALALLVFIVAWTMSGRRRGEEPVAPPPPDRHGSDRSEGT